MNILQISPQVPFPQDDGGRIGIHGIFKSLSDKGHQVYFLTFAKTFTVHQANELISQIGIPIVIKYNPTNSIFGVFKNLFSPVPYNLSKFYHPELHQQIKRILNENQIDVVHIDHLHMGWVVKWVKENTSIPVVLRQHNLEMRIMKRFSENQINPLLGWYAGLQYQKFLKYEPELCAQFDTVAMISAEDERELKSLNPNIPTVVIPGGMDSALLNRPLSKPDEFKIVHIGGMDWMPNRDSLEGFLLNVMPELVTKFPQLKLVAIGKGTDNIKIPETLSKSVQCKGFVEDLWAELSDALCVVVPLRVGGGIRVKILEMMAGGVPVVASDIGCEGIHIHPFHDILIANTVDHWHDAIELLQSNAEKRTEIIENAREFIRANHTWEHVGSQFESLYLSLIKKKPNQ